MTAWFAWREPATLGRVAGSWRQAAWIGVVGVTASACWFIAMTIQNAAYVRALGQIELVFTFIASALVFRERSNRKELAGVAPASVNRPAAEAAGRPRPGRRRQPPFGCCARGRSAPRR